MAQPAVNESKEPRTERGRRTMRKLLNAAAAEFSERGFHDASISAITRRAGVALGSFYTYFDSKDSIFSALVGDMSEAVKVAARAALREEMTPLEVERAVFEAFLRFAAEHKEIYRIIDEAEFVDPESWRGHYETTVKRIETRLMAGSASGELREGLGELHAWAVGGMNVFLGLRYVIWAKLGDPDLAEVAATANALLARGIAR